MTENRTLTVEHLIVGNTQGAHIELDSSSIHAHDRHGHTRLQAGVAGDGTPYLTLHDGNGQVRIQIAVNEEGQPLLTLKDHAGENRLKVTLYEGDSDPAIFLLNRYGTLRYEMSLEEDKPTFWTCNDNDERIPWGPRLPHKE